MRAALFTVVYPGLERWLPDWAAGVAEQTDGDFDLCVALDGLEPGAAAEAWRADLRARWFHAAPGATPAQVRNDALLCLVCEYDAIVLVDADDRMLPTRMEAAKAALRGADVTCCAMDIVDAGGAAMGRRFDPRAGEHALHRVNVFGFGNSAYSSRALEAALPVEAGCVLMDWYVASRARLVGVSMHVDPEPRMLYRQHGNNTARVVPPFTGEQVARATDLVLGHYALLERGVAGGLGGDYAAARDNAREFAGAINGDPGLLREYVAALNALEDQHVWWSFVAHPELEKIWKC